MKSTAVHTRRVGGSIVVSIPSAVLSEAGFDVNDEVVLKADKGKITIYRLEDLIEFLETNSIRRD